MSSLILLTYFLNFFATPGSKEQEQIKEANLNRKATFMELFKADYTVFEYIPVNMLNELIEWKFKLEEEKKKQMDENINSHKQQLNQPSSRKYVKK